MLQSPCKDWWPSHIKVLEDDVAGYPEPDFQFEKVMKVVVIRDGMESCHVAFLH